MRTAALDRSARSPTFEIRIQSPHCSGDVPIAGLFTPPVRTPALQTRTFKSATRRSRPGIATPRHPTPNQLAPDFREHSSTSPNTILPIASRDQRSLFANVETRRPFYRALSLTSASTLSSSRIAREGFPVARQRRGGSDLASERSVQQSTHVPKPRSRTPETHQRLIRLPEPIFDPEHKPSQNRAADQQRPNPTALCGPYAVDDHGLSSGRLRRHTRQHEY